METRPRADSRGTSRPRRVFAAVVLSRRLGAAQMWRMFRARRRTRTPGHGVHGAGGCAPEEQREGGPRPLPDEATCEADEALPAGPVGWSPEKPSVWGRGGLRPWAPFDADVAPVASRVAGRGGSW